MRYLRPLTVAFLLASLVASTVAPAVSAKTSTYSAEVDYLGMLNTYFEFSMFVYAVSPGQVHIEVDVTDWSIDPDSEDSDPSLIHTHATYSTTSFQLKATGNLGHGTLTGTLPLNACRGAQCGLLGSSLTVDLSFTGIGDRTGNPSEHIQRQGVFTGTISGAGFVVYLTGETGRLDRDKN